MNSLTAEEADHAPALSARCTTSYRPLTGRTLDEHSCAPSFLHQPADRDLSERVNQRCGKYPRDVQSVGWCIQQKHHLVNFAKRRQCRD